jgi:hypothetical protein
LVQVQQPAEERARAVVGHADLQRGPDLLVVLELVLELEPAARDLLALDQLHGFRLSKTTSVSKVVRLDLPELLGR